MDSPFDVSYTGTHFFEAVPGELWSELSRVDRFESWWPWMRDVRLEGTALSPGSVICFRIDPPIPFDLRISVSVTGSRAPEWIQGDVDGDLVGRARLELVPDGDATSATVSWDVEIADRKIRRMIHVARPLLLWAQRWAVEIALQGFRKHLRHR